MLGIGIHIIPLPQPTEDIGLTIASIGTIITIASNLTEDSEIRALSGKELHISSKFFVFFVLVGDRQTARIRIILRRGRGAIFICADALRGRSFASLSKRTTKHRRIYEKTSFTSIGSNRTGSGSGETS